jgi:uncharacterized protein (DUF58 family)
MGRDPLDGSRESTVESRQGAGTPRTRSVIVPAPPALQLGSALALLSLSGTLLPVLGWACVGALAALAVAVWWDGRALRPGCVELEREVPRRVSLGERERIRDELSNRTPHGLVVEVRDAAPPSVQLEPERRPALRLAAHGSGEQAFFVLARRRGEWALPPPLLRVRRPGGLAVRQWSLAQGTLLRVFPNVARLRRYELLRQRRALSGFGIHAARRAGLGAEFDHLRLYARGDDLRRVHWKATARRGFPVSQVVREERDQSVLIAVDLSHWMGVSAGELSRLDYAVDAAVFLAHVARRSGDRVGLALFAHELLALLPPSAQPGQERRLLEALAAVEPRPVHVSYRNLARGLLGRRLRRSLVVLLSEPIDEESGDELARALRALGGRHVPLAVSLADPELKRASLAAPASAQELCRRLAAGELREARAERLRELQQHGVHTLDLLPQELAVGLVNRYLELKSRRAL